MDHNPKTMTMRINPKNENLSAAKISTKCKIEHEFLQDMIVHHQVAVDMSENLLKKTSNPALISLANEIIRTQKYEIWFMTQLLCNP
jgi:uncharacterized protein (DUF305 family)